MSVPQVPESSVELEAMLADGILVEGLGFDAKATLEAGEKANRGLAIDIASMAVAGGLIAIGIREEGDRLMPSPISLANLRERISQVARSRIEPPVSMTTVELAAHEEGSGYILAIIPTSPLAPHQVEGCYRGRGDSTNYVMGDAEVRRIHSARSQSRPELRVGLVEQLENCRAWLACDPARGGAYVFDRLRDVEPRLTAVGAIVDRIELAPGLAVMLIWEMASIRQGWKRIAGALDAIRRTVNGAPNPRRETEVRDLWPVMLERLQVTAALLAAEARRGGQDELATTHDDAPWTIVPQRPDRWREMIAIGDRQDGIPSFPADPAFADVRPEARDRAGAASGARQEQALHDAVNPEVRRLLRRR